MRLKTEIIPGNSIEDVKDLCARFSVHKTRFADFNGRGCLLGIRGLLLLAIETDYGLISARRASTKAESIIFETGCIGLGELSCALFSKTVLHFDTRCQ